MCLCCGALGCYEIDQEFTVNPNGSGKVTVDAKLIFPVAPAKPGEDRRSTAQRAVSTLLAGSSGVTAWQDIRFARLDAHRIHFAGTAYFDDVSKLEMMEIQAFIITWAQAPAACRQLSLDFSREIGGPKPIRLAEEEIQKRVLKQQSGYTRNKIAMSSIGKGRVRLTFRLPGKVKHATNLKVVSDDALCLSFKTSQLWRAMDKLIRDEAWVRRQILAGYDLSEHIPARDPTLRAEVLGDRGPVTVVVGGELEPLFDYEAEVEQAKKEFPAMIKRLGLEMPSAPVHGT